MNDKNITYSKQVIEIADFLYKYPDKKMSEVLSYFVVFCRKNKRTIERWAKQAKKYNKERLLREEKIKEDIQYKEKENAIKSSILSRNQCLEILSTIANGTARKINNDVLIPTDADRTRAIQTLAKFEGWEAPAKTAQTDSKGNKKV